MHDVEYFDDLLLASIKHQIAGELLDAPATTVLQSRIGKLIADSQVRKCRQALKTAVSGFEKAASRLKAIVGNVLKMKMSVSSASSFRDLTTLRTGGASYVLSTFGPS